MFTNKTKKLLTLVPVTALILSVLLTGKAFADEVSGPYSDTQPNQQLQTLINWNGKVQAILSTKLENNLKMEMQDFASKQSAESVHANQQPDSTERDLVLIGANKNGTGVTAHSTTPVVVIIDRKELCLLNI